MPACHGFMNEYDGKEDSGGLAAFKIFPWVMEQRYENY
jgi:hypothetical protein